MKSILLIGLGRFGKHIAMELHSLGHQVMAVDHNEVRVNEALSFLTSAQIGDSTRRIFFLPWAYAISMSALLLSELTFKVLWKPHRS